MNDTINMRRNLKYGLLILTLLLTAAMPVMSQVYARVGGTVKTKDGKPLEGVRILMIFSDKNQVEYVTDAKGRWNTRNLRAGTWTVGYMSEGYKPENINVTLSALKDNPDIHIVLQPIPKSPLTVGNALYQDGKYAEALVEFEKLAAAGTNSFTVLEKIGLCYFRLDQKDKAVDFFKKALMKEPAARAVLTNISAILLEKGNLDEGLSYFKKLDENSISDHSIFYNIGILQFNDNKMDEAISYFKKCVARNDGYVEGWYQMAMAFLNQGDMAAAKENFKKVIQLAPDSPKAAQCKELLKEL